MWLNRKVSSSYVIKRNGEKIASVCDFEDAILMLESLLFQGVYVGTYELFAVLTNGQERFMESYNTFDYDYGQERCNHLYLYAFEQENAERYERVKAQWNLLQQPSEVKSRNEVSLDGTD